MLPPKTKFAVKLSYPHKTENNPPNKPSHDKITAVLVGERRRCAQLCKKKQSPVESSPRYNISDTMLRSTEIENVLRSNRKKTIKESIPAVTSWQQTKTPELIL
jgi:hypothetical protein